MVSNTSQSLCLQRLLSVRPAKAGSRTKESIGCEYARFSGMASCITLDSLFSILHVHTFEKFARGTISNVLQAVIFVSLNGFQVMGAFCVSLSLYALLWAPVRRTDSDMLKVNHQREEFFTHLIESKVMISEQVMD